jgi:predicted phage terminase large subunit-like protein
MRKYLPIRTITAADLASSDAESADYTVIITGGMDSSGNLFLLDKYIRKGIDAVEILREMIRQMSQYHSYEGIIEKNRYESLMTTCRKLVDKGFYGPPHEVRKITRRIHLVPHYTDKLDRFMSSVPQMIKAHQIWMPSDWLDVKEFLLLHPAVEHDDIGDALEMLVSFARPPAVTANTMVAAGRLIDRHAPLAGRSINESLAAKKYNVWTGTLNANKGQRRSY